MFDYNLGLMTGVDLPIPELQAILHQPSIKEISMIGEQDFFIGIQLLCINKNLYIDNKEMLENTTNFQLFMMIINEKQTAEKKNAVQQVFSLLFPQAKVMFTPRSIILNYPSGDIIIDEDNFQFLQQMLNICFCLKGSGQEQFNPKGNKAQEIAKKLMKSRQRIAAQKMQGEGAKSSMFTQYISILTIGLNSMSLQDVCNLTMYQVYDLVERYTLYINWDLDIRSRLAGGKPDHPAENWMKNIH